MMVPPPIKKMNKAKRQPCLAIKAMKKMKSKWAMTTHKNALVAQLPSHKRMKHQKDENKAKNAKTINKNNQNNSNKKSENQNEQMEISISIYKYIH